MTDSKALDYLKELNQRVTIGGSSIGWIAIDEAAQTDQTDLFTLNTKTPDASWQTFALSGRQSGKTLTMERELARYGLRDMLHKSLEQSDPPMGDVRWLIERPVTVVRNGLPFRQPLHKFQFLRHEKLEDMPIAHEREGVASVLNADNGCTHDWNRACWFFAEEF